MAAGRYSCATTWPDASRPSSAPTAGFASSLLLSLELALATIAVVLLLMVPAMVALRLGAPRLQPVVEVVCSLPLVVPPCCRTGSA